jgi:hypothetical protein
VCRALFAFWHKRGKVHATLVFFVEIANESERFASLFSLGHVDRRRIGDIIDDAAARYG